MSVPFAVSVTDVQHALDYLQEKYDLARQHPALGREQLDDYRQGGAWIARTPRASKVPLEVD